jgi:hypothetical protein
MLTVRLITVVAIATVCASCARTTMHLPTQPGTFVQGDQASFVYFNASCQPCTLEPLTAQAAVRGTIGGRPIDGRFSFAAWALRLRLESVGRMPREFLYTAEEGRETLVYRSAFELRGGSTELIEAILGLPLKAEDLRRVLTACPRISGTLSGERFDDRWFKIRLDDTPSYDVYARRDDDGIGWSIEAIVGAIEGTPRRWRAEYQRDSVGRLRSVRLVSVDWNDARSEQFDVRITFSQIRVHPLLGPETFRASMPAPLPIIDVAGFRKLRAVSTPFLVDSRVR